jgi:hypothetical protein
MRKGVKQKGLYREDLVGAVFVSQSVAVLKCWGREANKTLL